uniref:Mitochondrial distribution and morphology protein 31 n=1 Tax=Kwoniella dejecticola CBS 10117 TaxID=1296121 RepID=A0A1A6AFJ5_9TREE|nr:mitochondrial distribution and morphology protein 31 [Kwoniella dejecticola CBS 10117]OBR88798.1 mitochondrial distribution and morphology protein 31 [Kwoniella dejecticola CBS 10117]
MQVTRSITTFSSTSFRSTSSSSLIGRGMRSRSAQADRYLSIHDFFTRQASTLAVPRPPARSHSATKLFSSRQRTAFSRRWSSTKENDVKAPCPNCQGSSVTNTPLTPPPPDPTPPHPQGHAQDYAPFIRRLIKNSGAIAPNSPHRPTKEELLNAASGWWQRLRIRLKWFTIRGWRRFNTDDMSAFASFFVLGNTLWILVGTTTFVSAVFATLNSLSLQEYVARWISDYMTYNTGVTVIFESAIVPKWASSTIVFRNVFVSRRAATDEAESEFRQTRSAKASTAKPPSPTPFLSSAISPDTYLAPPLASESDNYTMFDVNIDEVEVSLSLKRWLDGKGLIKDAKVKGVRGVVDRRSVWWDMSKPLLPADFRHETRSGDFEFDSFQVEDALITVYQPGGQRPYNVSIFNAMIGPLRKRWLFYDLMCAEGMTGQFDNCLFSLHMPQKLGKTREDGDLVKRMARFRIDGMPVEHAQYATGHTGPISWITSGKLDAVLDIKFPFHPDDSVDIKAIFDEISRNVVTITQQGVHPEDPSISLKSAIDAANEANKVIPGQARLARPPLRAPKSPTLTEEEIANRRQVVVDIDLRFRDLKAAVPIYTTDLSVTNNALIRPIVAFINANKTLVPIHCQVAADLNDFDGSWTVSGLMTSLSDQIYAALAHHVSSEAANSKRIRQVGFWGIQRGAEVLVDTLRNVVDPAHAQLAAV